MKADKNVFPYKLNDCNGNGTVYIVLKVRDYVAIQAMLGILANSSCSECDVDEIARQSYQAADAMIKQSEVKA